MSVGLWSFVFSGLNHFVKQRAQDRQDFRDFFEQLGTFDQRIAWAVGRIFDIQGDFVVIT